jgi:iron complex outermembrane receptor protein
MKKTAIASAIAIATMLPISSVVMSQSDESMEVEEIIVSVSRRDVAVMDLSQSVQAIPEEVLAQPAFNDVRDVYNRIPGATAGITQGQKAPIAEGIQLRGSGVTQTNAGGGAMPVGYYIDDVPFLDVGALSPPPLSTFDLSRIEVIRGPQGTSYGQDSSAGSVIMRTNGVDLENAGYKVKLGTMTYGKGNGYGSTMGAIVNVPLIADKLGVRISYLTEEDPGYAIVVGRPEVDNPLEEKKDTLRAKVTWLPTDNSEVTYTHSKWNTAYGFLPGTNIVGVSNGRMELGPATWAFALEVFPDGLLKNNIDVEWDTLVVKYDLGFAEMTYSGGAVKSTDRDYNADDFTYGVTSITKLPSDTDTHEIRLVSQGDGPLSWVAGMMTVDATTNSDLYYNFMTYGEYSSIGAIHQEQDSMYGELTYAMSDTLTVFGGLRQHEETRVEATQEAMRNPGDPATGPYTGYMFTDDSVTYEFDNTSYRVGVEWRPDDSSLYYASRSSAARMPVPTSAATLAILAAEGIPNLSSTDASELISTEIGAKLSLMDDTLDMEVVYALSEWTDIPMWSGYGTANGPLSMAVGGTDADVTSFELQLDYDISETLSLIYAGAITDSEVAAIPDPAVVSSFPAAIQVGGELSGYSPTTHSITLDYSDEMDNGWEAYGSVDYAYRDKMNGFSSVVTADAYIEAASDYKLLNLAMGMRKENWDLNLSITNAANFDGQYTPDLFPSSPNDTLIMFPRAIHFQVTYDML